MQSLLTHLECTRCATRHEADQAVSGCSECGGPVFARYDLDKARQTLNPDAFAARGPSMWRYAELLPVTEPQHVVSLGEGSTPIIHVSRLADEELGMTNVFLKDEGRNPTGTFKARGASATVSRHCQLGIQKFAVPTAGNAGGALAAYAAAAGSQAFIACPDDTPLAARIEAHVAGATLRRVPGTIDDAAKLVREKVENEGYFDCSTFREPYRVEGKKTIGFEIAEAFQWSLPDVIVTPVGGGTALVAMWKAFQELASSGLTDSPMPRMVAVQAETCAPIVRAFAAGDDDVRPWDDPVTLAAGMRVPSPRAAKEVLAAIRASDGTAVAVPDDSILRAAWKLGKLEGVFACPEGAATVAALQKLREDGWVDQEQKVVLLNTGSGLKYVDLFKQEPPPHVHEPYDAHDH